MKKTIFLLAIISAVLSSCSKDSFTIKGEFKEDTFNGKQVFLYKVDSDSLMEPVILDSTLVDNNRFIFKGDDKLLPNIGLISIAKLDDRSPYEDDADSPVATFILEPGTTNVAFDGATVTVGGTPRNDSFNKIHTAISELTILHGESQKYGGMEQIPPNAEGKDGVALFQDQMSVWREVTYDFTSNNMDNRAGQFMFLTSYRTMFTPEQLTKLMDMGDENFKQKPEIQELKELLDSMGASASAPAAKAEGNVAIDVDLKDATGKTVTLYSIINKNEYTLIDFWASWCGPCIREVPNLKKAYDQYKGKGFEIVGISLDNEKSDMDDAIKKNTMNWMHFFDEGGSAANQYGVQSIPFTLLVDKTGTVIATSLRGNQLETILAERLK